MPLDDAVHVREIADMLFVKDDLRVRSASYAMLPPLDLDAADAAKNLLKCDTSLDPSANQQLSGLATAKRSTDWYGVLAALHAWHDVMATGRMEPRSPESIMRRLTGVVWHYTFMHYFWMKDEREKSKTGRSAADASSVTGS